MDLEILKIVGQIAGLGGIAIGASIIIFRNIIIKNIFPKLSPEYAFKLLRLIVILTWSIAIVGLFCWTYAYTRLDKKQGSDDGKPPITTSPVDSLSSLSTHSIEIIDAGELSTDQAYGGVKILDFKVRNLGANVAYLKLIEIEVLDESLSEQTFGGYSYMPSSKTYNIRLKPATGKKLYKLCDVSNIVKPNDGDRFQIAFAQFVSDTSHVYVQYNVRVRLHYNQNEIIYSDPILFRVATIPDSGAFTDNSCKLSVSERMQELGSSNPIEVRHASDVLRAANVNESISALENVFEVNPTRYILTYQKTVPKSNKYVLFTAQSVLQDMYTSIFRSLIKLSGSSHEHLIDEIPVEYRFLAAKALYKAKANILD